MWRGVTLAGVLAVAVALASGVADAGHLRRHRVFFPPPELPSQLAVDEAEYTMRPSQLVVAAGQVTINAYNRGMDDHDVQFTDSQGQVHVVFLHSGGQGVLTADLKPGTYHFICSLFEGTPQSHDALGMHFDLTVK
jgi:plastocyanin